MTREFKINKRRYRMQSVREEDLEPGNETAAGKNAEDAGEHSDDEGDQSSAHLLSHHSSSEVNAHTYVYEPNKSFKGMTLEALPVENNYRDMRLFLEQQQQQGEKDKNGKNGSHLEAIAEVGGAGGAAGQRPTLEQLKQGHIMVEGQKIDGNNANGDAETGNGEMKKSKAKGKVVKFGWIDGVYMRCLLNIWGVMLFLRLTTIIGQCGIVQGLLVILLCNVVTTITAISMSAVSTNGMIQGGGIYYLISRSLGPEFGGAIGIMFTVANSIAVATYLIGFCDSVLDMAAEYSSSFAGITGAGRVNDIRVIGAATLVAILGLALVGMEWVTRVQIGLLGLLILSQMDFFVGSVMGPSEGEERFGFTGYKWETFKDNLMETHYHAENEEKPQPTFFYWFGVFFPAVTGIVAGANLSGDLKDPSSAIPKGTLLAILTTFISYILYGTMIGAVYIPEASGNQTEYEAFLNPAAFPNLTAYDVCEPDRKCSYGSSNDQQTMSKISFTGFLVYAGCFAATLSSAIASLVGAPRVLQALGKDRLYPYMDFFARGYGANNDPLRGYFLVFLVALAMTMIGNLDAVSTLLSNFFVAAYALINFSVFHATVTKQPGWRPSFKYYNQWVALIGTFLCVFVMFAIDWLTAIVTFVIVIVLYMYIAYAKPEANWGSSTQGQQFVAALKGVQALNETPDHVKNYRPKVLAFTGNPAHRLPLVDFANLIAGKASSLLICAHVSEEHLTGSAMDALKASVRMWLSDHSIKGFYSVAPANAGFSEGAKAQIHLAGLGRLCPNMVLLGYKSNWKEDSDGGGTQTYFELVNTAFDLNLSLAILRLEGGLDYSDVIGREESITLKQKQKEEEEEEEKEAGETARVRFSSRSKRRRSSVASAIFRQKNKSSPLSNPEAFVASSSGGGALNFGGSDQVAVYKGQDGRPLDKDTVEKITRFQVKRSGGHIDVWWLYDDGGLTLLIPYILTTRSQFSNCKLRVFSLANRADELARETRNMASLLAKFRIDFSDVTVIPDVTKKAAQETRQEFQDLVKSCDGKITEEELLAQKEKTNRHLRLAELLREHSTDAEMVIMTLPMPRRDTHSSWLYLSWLEIMTRQMPPFLLVRGNQTSVLTFYS